MFDEREIEAGEQAEAGERAAAIARIRAGLHGEGSDECVDCGCGIPAARRAALPSAERCVTCQSRHERKGAARLARYDL
ncbi:MAG: TraR/DksA C4-type zinc finger protein [Pseudomonadota bacterium]|nr:TraR/DksA C4-type zinc finger protein [Pseudomonadota bacterium]